MWVFKFLKLTFHYTELDSHYLISINKHMIEQFLYTNILINSILFSLLTALDKTLKLTVLKILTIITFPKTKILFLSIFIHL